MMEVKKNTDLETLLIFHQDTTHGWLGMKPILE